MRYTHNSELTGDLTLLNADILHDVMDFDGQIVRKWRNRGYFSSGEKVGRSYIYNVADLAHLMIMREMHDIGLKTSAAVTAAEIGAMDLVAHALRQAPMIELWGAPDTDLDAMVELIRHDPDIIPALFESDLHFQLPSNYLVTGGDDFDDWQLINELDGLEELEEQFNLATVFLDLRKLANRMISVLKGFSAFADGTAYDSTQARPPRAINFWTNDCIQEGARIIQFSMNVIEPPIPILTCTNNPDFKIAD